jgi:hypothetical protein
VLTRRWPSTQDIENTFRAAGTSRRAVTEFIEWPLPDGRRALTAYTVEPPAPGAREGRVTIRYQGLDGTPVERSFGSVPEYRVHYSERSTYVEPHSTEWEFIMRDLDEFYRRGGGEGSRASTAVGIGGGAPMAMAAPPEPGAPGAAPPEAGTPDPAAPGPEAPGAAPPRPGEPQRGDGTAFTLPELRELLTRALRRDVPLSELNAELGVDDVTFAAAYREAGGRDPRLPLGFTDARNGRIWARASGGPEATLTAFHEAIHQMAFANGDRAGFVHTFGTYLEEAITEHITRETLGPHAARAAYDQNVRMVMLMENYMNIPVETLRAAYLDGRVTELVSAIEGSLGGDARLSDRLIDDLRRAATDPIAVNDMRYIIGHRKAPPPP